ncbi:MAG: hypothetical protein H7Y16_11440 [Candidatus Parcubacteria bacterium]|nr:hypothetical protein [Burkholderiales bacterium]
MRSAKIRFFALALVLGLSACGGVRWQKAGADDAELSRDLSACRRDSQMTFGIAGGQGAMPGMDPRFGPPSGPSQSEQMMQAAQAVNACMRKRGYELVPDKK